MTLAKFHHLRETSLPTILGQTSKLLDTDFSRDQSTLLEVVDNMDEMVFDDYVRRRSEKLIQVVEEGILHGGVDWLNAPKPTGGCCNDPGYSISVLFRATGARAKHKSSNLATCSYCASSADNTYLASNEYHSMLI